MKPLTTILTVSLFLALGLIALSPPETQAEAAVVINDQTCGFLDGDGNPVSTTNSHSVDTNSKNGNTLLTCKATVPNSTGKAVRYDFDNTGLQCATVNGGTEKWHETVSASGQAKLVCQLPD